MKWLATWVVGAALFGSEPSVISHETIREFSMNGNTLQGLCTKEMGAEEIEVWHSSIAVGSQTPRHVHDSEEIVVLLKGEILGVVGDKETLCSAPATLICPANVPHQLLNVGSVPTDHFVILRIDSKIYNANGDEMELPWR